MPNYEGNIDPAELSSVVNQTSTQMQSVSMAIDRMTSRMDRMVELFGKVRDFTRDERREMEDYRKSISDVAEQYKRMNTDRVKGMNEYSVALKAIEDRIQKSYEAEKKAIEETKQAREKLSKIEEASTVKNKKERHKALKDALGVEKANAVEINRIRDRERQLQQQKLEANTKLSRDAVRLRAEDEKRLQVAEKLYRSGKQRMADGGGRGVDALELASDLNLPGVSQAALIAKYARRGMDGGEGDGMGAAGLLARGAGLLRGVGLGTAVAGGAYTMLQGYKAYNTAHQMAPMARTLFGQTGGSAARHEAIGAYGGYGGVENLQTLMALNRQMGGRYAPGQMRQITDISNMFGLSREEAGGQAGAMIQAGIGPRGAAADLKNIMIEGVKGGMDRARITEFTSQIIGIQENIFRATGENNIQAISQAVGQLMRASGRGEAFMRGPEMMAVQGIDAAVKAAGRGSMGGPGLGTLYRAFGFGAGAQRFGTEQYYDARKQLEGGIFQGDAVSNINKIFSQYGRESGGNNRLRNIRMADELGIGINQIERLDTIRQKAATGQLTKKDMDELKKLQEEAKDPMQRILDINAKMNENLARLAGSDAGIGAVVRIDTALLSVQEQALSALQRIANALAPEGEGRAGGMAELAGGLGVGVAAYKGLGGLAGGLKAGGLKGGMAAARAGLGRVPLLAALAGIGGGGANLYDMLTHKGGSQGFFKDFESRTGGYGAMDWLMHPGDALTKAGAMGGDAIYDYVAAPMMGLPKRSQFGAAPGMGAPAVQTPAAVTAAEAAVQKPSAEQKFDALTAALDRNTRATEINTRTSPARGPGRVNGNVR